MIFLGIDDTDMPGTPGTNQLARRLAAVLPAGFTCDLILRHQLLDDPRVPCTSQNGSASLRIRHEPGLGPEELVPMLRREMGASFVPGSDPGFCVARAVPDSARDFATRCQRELVTQEEARETARAAGLHLEEVGGTGGGVIGALAAVGLAAGGNDGRVIHLPGWSWPDEFSGRQSVEKVRGRGVEEIRDCGTGAVIASGTIDVGKHLRPNRRKGRVVLLVEPVDDGSWKAVKLP